MKIDSCEIVPRFLPVRLCFTALTSITLVLTSSCGVKDMNYYETGGSASQSVSQGARTVSVTASGGWQPTGVMVAAGDRVHFTASGSWMTGVGFSTGPEGAIQPIYFGQPPCPQHTTNCLIGRIERGDVFLIGREAVVNASQSGQIYARCNDYGMGDNSGSLTLTITPKRQAAQATSPQVIYRDRPVPVPVPQKPDWR